MALDTTKTSKLAKTVVVNAILNSAYLTRGASKIDEAQMAGKRNGETYSFVVDDITAAKFNAGTAPTGTLTSRSVDLSVKNYGTSLELSGVQKALDLGNWEDLAGDVGAAIANKACEDTATSDMQKISATKVSNYKGIAKAAAKLASKYSGKIYGFADPCIIGELAGEGRNAQPINVGEQWGVNLEGKLFNISELRTMNLPKVIYASGDTDATHSFTIGDLIAGANGVIAPATKTDELPTGVTGDTKITADVECAAMILRVDGAQAYGDAGVNLAGEKQSKEGVTVAQHVVDAGGFKETYEWASSVVAGIADANKAAVVLMPV